jgi:ABC-type antimicrobial peptide transport system permease subunit
MYSTDPQSGINQANPLVEGILFENSTFNIVGVCVDPINNGLVTYVNIHELENITRISSPNIVLVTLNNSGNQSTAILQIKALIESTDPNLNIFSLDNLVQRDANFLSSNWQTIMIIPLFSLVSAALCLVGYMMLAADDQHQEFAVLRAVGARPRIVVAVLAIQSMTLLLASFGIGILFGTIATVIVLMQQPMITVFAMLQIVGWLLVALSGMFLLSLYPAYKLSKARILKIMSQ